MGVGSGNFVRLSDLRKLRQYEQVAAVCYRIGNGSVEFLLVRTRGRRWTFPKGGVEPGLTHAQAAALEAFEEAGVHGRIEEAAFACYLSGKREIHAHLCEVLSLSPPQESGRDRTWFSAGKAKRRLQEDRETGEGNDAARVVDRALACIKQLRWALLPQLNQIRLDPLQRVQFEAQRDRTKPAFARYTSSGGSPAGLVPADTLGRGRVLQLKPKPDSP